VANKPYRVVGTNPRLNILLHGDPGSGKTTLAATAQDHPEMKNVLFLNIEGGLLSIAHRGDIHAVKIPSTAELEEQFWKLNRGEYPTVQTVVIDSMTEMQTINLEEIVASAMQGGQTQSRRGKPRSADDIWQDDYGKSTTQLKRLIRYFKDSNYNVIVTALSKYVYPKIPEGTDVTQIDPLAVLPSLTAKLATSVMGYMDMNWYCYKDNDDDQYKILTTRTKDSPFHAKTRGPRFAEAIGEIVVNPHLGELYDTFVRTVSDQSVPKPKRKKS
jgi:hypothetical protein